MNIQYRLKVMDEPKYKFGPLLANLINARGQTFVMFLLIQNTKKWCSIWFSSNFDALGWWSWVWVMVVEGVSAKNLPDLNPTQFILGCLYISGKVNFLWRWSISSSLSKVQFLVELQLQYIHQTRMFIVQSEAIIWVWKLTKIIKIKSYSRCSNRSFSSIFRSW